MFQPISCRKANSGLPMTITLCFSLHFPVTHTSKNYHLNWCFLCDMSISDLLDCLFSYDKTSIKMICLFLGTWQETNMLYFPCQKAENFLKVALISKQELILPRDFWCCYFCSLHGHPPEVWSNYKLLKNCNLASKGVILRSKWETVTVTTNDQTIWMPSIWKVTVLAPCSIACSQKRT